MKTIIFDFDGTLADSFGVIIDIVKKITRNKVTISSDQVNKIREMTITELAGHLNIKKYRWPWLLYVGKKEMNKHIQTVELHDGIKQMIEDLSKKHVRIMLLSSNSVKNIKYVLKKNNIAHKFEKIYGGAGLLSKASAIRKVMKKNKLDINDVIYIGDEVRDGDAAETLGIPFIAVTWGFSSAKSLEKQQPYKLANNTKELKKYIEEWIR